MKMKTQIVSDNQIIHANIDGNALPVTQLLSISQLYTLHEIRLGWRLKKFLVVKICIPNPQLDIPI
jgi:hypothetical protein